MNWCLLVCLVNLDLNIYMLIYFEEICIYIEKAKTTYMLGKSTEVLSKK